MDYKKLYDALMIIKSICEQLQNGPGCEDCPMSMDNGAICCVTDTTPDNWDVILPETKVMR